MKTSSSKHSLLAGTLRLAGIASLALVATFTVACAQTTSQTSAQANIQSDLSSQPTPANGPVVLTEPGAITKVTIIGESAAGKTVSVAQGSAVNIRLQENLSTGYHWTVHVKSGFVGYIRPSYEPGPAMPGAPGTAVFAFHAGKKGTTTLLFDYGRGAGIPAAETIEMSVEVK